jgi:hypothetical protein
MAHIGKISKGKPAVRSGKSTTTVKAVKNRGTSHNRKK